MAGEVFAMARDAVPAVRGRFLRRSGFGVMAFVIGSITLDNAVAAFEDPGGWLAVALVAALVVPIAALGALAWYRPDSAVRVLGVLIGVVIAGSIWFALAPEAWGAFEDRNGPVRFIATFILAGPLGLLGLKRTEAAGLMLVVLAIVQIAISTLGSGLGLAVMGTASLISGGLYLASAARSRRTAPPGNPEAAPRAA